MFIVLSPFFVIFTNMFRLHTIMEPQKVINFETSESSAICTTGFPLFSLELFITFVKKKFCAYHEVFHHHTLYGFPVLKGSLDCQR